MCEDYIVKMNDCTGSAAVRFLDDFHCASENRPQRAKRVHYLVIILVHDLKAARKFLELCKIKIEFLIVAAGVSRKIHSLNV